MRLVLYPSFIFFSELSGVESEDLKKFYTHISPGCWFSPFYKNWKKYNQFIEDLNAGVFLGTPEEIEETRQRLSRQRMWDGTICYFNSRKSTLPIGFLHEVLGRYQIDSITECRNTMIIYDYDFEINSHIEKKSGEKLIESRDYQMDAISISLIHKLGIFKMAVNAGKTLMFVLLSMIYRKNKVLILVHRKEIFTQILKAFRVYVNYDKVGIISSDSVVIGDEITVAMVQSFGKKMDELQDFINSVNILMIDEVHHASSTTYVNILKKSRAYVRHGFTGTLPDDPFELAKVIQYMGPVISCVSSQELITRGISVPPRIHIVRTDSYDINSEKNTYIESIDLNVKYNRDKILKIVNICDKFREKKVLIISDYLSLARIISKSLDSLGFSNVLFFGGTKDRECILSDFVHGNSKILVATTVMDEGVDIEDIDVVVLAFPRKNYRQTFQRIGRGMRASEGKTHVDVFDFADENDTYLMNHLRKRCEYYSSEEFQYSYVDGDEYESRDNEARLQIIDRECLSEASSSSGDDDEDFDGD